MKQKKIIIACNWKLNPKTKEVARGLITAYEKSLGTTRKVQIIVFPPALFAHEIVRVASKKKRVKVGVQHTAKEEEGAYTGESSMPQVKSIGATYVLIGHAERRAKGETNDDISDKVFQAVTSGLTPVICVGEAERDTRGAYLEMVKVQVLSACRKLPHTMRGRVMIAYEPVYAIGAAHSPANDTIYEMVSFIRKVLMSEYGNAVARAVPILYGGAVDESGATTLLTSVHELDGLLVGRVSIAKERAEALITNIKSM